ncbi:MAG: ACT domain-containing protein [Synergistetes bacterium]|nr:ACT domain-containing protein [Synergistota bacterium]
MSRAVITVIGVDKVGIVAGISGLLAEYNVNIEDISQTTMQGIFVMAMIVNISQLKSGFSEFKDALLKRGKELGVEIWLQREEIFKAMHRV